MLSLLVLTSLATTSQASLKLKFADSEFGDSRLFCVDSNGKIYVVPNSELPSESSPGFDGNTTDSPIVFNGQRQMVNGSPNKYSVTGDLPWQEIVNPVVCATTYVEHMNDAVTVVGEWAKDDRIHGFFWQSDNFATYDYPGANATFIRGNSNCGNWCGYYLDQHGKAVGLAGVKTVQRVEAPNAVMTYAHGINDYGVVVGSFQDGMGVHGFIATGGAIQKYDCPYDPPKAVDVKGEIYHLQSVETHLEDVNNSGKIGGNVYMTYTLGTKMHPLWKAFTLVPNGQ